MSGSAITNLLDLRLQLTTLDAFIEENNITDATILANIEALRTNIEDDNTQTAANAISITTDPLFRSHTTSTVHANTGSSALNTIVTQSQTANLDASYNSAFNNAITSGKNAHYNNLSLLANDDTYVQNSISFNAFNGLQYQTDIIELSRNVIPANVTTESQSNLALARNLMDSDLANQPVYDHLGGLSTLIDSSNYGEAVSNLRKARDDLSDLYIIDGSALRTETHGFTKDSTQTSKTGILYDISLAIYRVDLMHQYSGVIGAANTLIDSCLAGFPQAIINGINTGMQSMELYGGGDLRKLPVKTRYNSLVNTAFNRQNALRSAILAENPSLTVVSLGAPTTERTTISLTPPSTTTTTTTSTTTSTTTRTSKGAYTISDASQTEFTQGFNSAQATYQSDLTAIFDVITTVSPRQVETLRTMFARFEKIATSTALAAQISSTTRTRIRRIECDSYRNLAIQANRPAPSTVASHDFGLLRRNLKYNITNLQGAILIYLTLVPGQTREYTTGASPDGAITLRLNTTNGNITMPAADTFEVNDRIVVDTLVFMFTAIAGVTITEYTVTEKIDVTTPRMMNVIYNALYE